MSAILAFISLYPAIVTAIVVLSVSTVSLGIMAYSFAKKRKPERKTSESAKLKKEEASEAGIPPGASKNRKEPSIVRNVTPKDKKDIMSVWISYLILGLCFIYLGLISDYLVKSSTTLPYIRILFENPIIFFVIGFSMMGGVANVFQNTILGNRSVTLYKNLEEQKHLFLDKAQYQMLMRRFLFNAYSKSWNFWTEVQPLLSALVGIIVYFVLVSGISWSGSVPEHPNPSFFSAVGFLSGFFYDKFLDFLQKISGQLLGNEAYEDKITSLINEFVNAKMETIEESVKKENALGEEVAAKKE